MFYVKKSQLFKKHIKLRIEVVEDPQKHARSGSQIERGEVHTLVNNTGPQKKVE